MSEGINISPDRIIVIAIGLLVAFNTFRDETKETDSGFSNQLTRIELTQEAILRDNGRFQKFMEEPRFSAPMFQTEMAPRDNLDARQDIAIDKLRDGKNEVTEKIDDLRQEFIEFKYQLNREPD